MFGIVVFVIFIVIVLMIAASCIRIVPQAHALIVERLGMYKDTWGTGLHIKMPFVDRIAKRVNLKEQCISSAASDVYKRQ